VLYAPAGDVPEAHTRVPDTEPPARAPAPALYVGDADVLPPGLADAPLPSEDPLPEEPPAVLIPSIGDGVTDALGHVDSSLDALRALQQVTGWTPGSANIRPTPRTKARKEAELAAALEVYASERDLVLAKIFGHRALPRAEDGKLVAEASLEDAPPGAEHVFMPNAYPYRDLAPGVQHSVLWYWPGRPGRATTAAVRDSIAADLSAELDALVGPGQYEFIWYENPCMSIPCVFHVQVFWRRKLTGVRAFLRDLLGTWTRWPAVQ